MRMATRGSAVAVQVSDVTPSPFMLYQQGGCRLGHDESKVPFMNISSLPTAQLHAASHQPRAGHSHRSEKKDGGAAQPAQSQAQADATATTKPSVNIVV